MKRIMALLAASTLVVATSGARLSAPLEPPSTLRVFAAASLTDAFRELGQKLEHDQPGLAVRFNFAGSQQLALQMEQGAKADVFASADQRWMSYVDERHLVAETPTVFVRNRLVVIVPKTNPGRINRLEDLARRGIKFVIAAEAVPAGKYSREALQQLAKAPGFPSDYDRRVLANTVSQEENVKAVVAKVQLGEADAGIVYRSDVTPAAARVVRAIDIPDAYNVLASYPIAAIKGAENAEGARAFIALVLSAEGQQVLQRHGFLPLNAGASAGAVQPTRP
jgi:molybdate transport system substrate-binding protein